MNGQRSATDYTKAAIVIGVHWDGLAKFHLLSLNHFRDT
jgi:hypothetical protein